MVRFTRMAGLAALLVALGGGGAALALAQMTPNEGDFVVANAPAEGAPLRAAPSADAAVVALLPENTIVAQVGPDAVADGATWRNVRDAEARSGFLPVEMLAMAPWRGESGAPPGAVEPSEVPQVGPPTSTDPPPSAPDAVANPTTDRPDLGNNPMPVPPGGDILPGSAPSGPENPNATPIVEETAPDGRPMRAGSILVSFQPGTSEAAQQAAHQAAGALAVEPLLLPDTVRVEVAPGTTAQALAAYRARSDVRAADPNYIVRATGGPSIGPTSDGPSVAPTR